MSRPEDAWRELLGAAVPEPSPTDPRSDLARGRTALRRRRIRQARVAGAGMAATIVLVALVGGELGGPRTAPDDVAGPPVLPSAAPSASPDPSAGAESDEMTTKMAPGAGIRLLSQKLEAGPFTFGRTPEGWVTQGQSEFAATIAPTDGSVSDDPSDYRGKITVMMASPDQPVRPPGSRVEVREGRRFVVSRTADGGATWVTTRTLPSEPPGRVMVQFWDGSPWDEQTMVNFAASVRVTGEVVTAVG